jgi:ferrous iron transport protein A
MMPLTFASLGEVVKIKKITGKDETVKFLNRLGLIEGHDVTVVSRCAGNLILNVKDTRVALGSQLGNRIVV